MEGTDLSFVTTDELIEEMVKRFDSMVLAWVKSLDEAKDGREVVYSKYWGGRAAAIGLCDYAKEKILHECRNQFSEVEPDEGEDV